MGVRRLACGAVAAALLSAPAGALAAPDTPDPGFGTAGTVVTGFAGRAAESAGMILDGGGRPVVVARTGAAELGALRLTPSGSPDPTFAAGPTAIGGSGDARLPALLEHAGGYVAGGWIEPMPGDLRFGLVRYTAGGTLDGGFGSAGVVSDPLDAGDDEVRALALDSGQRIVAAGRSGQRLGVARYGPDGAPDAGFSRVHDLVGVAAEEASAVVVEPGGRVVVAGTGAVAGGERRFLLVALTAAGTIDPAFGAAAGAVTLDVGDGIPAVRALRRQPDGKLLVAGTTDASGAGGGVVARFTPDGTPDPTFGGGDGIARLGVTGAIVEDIALQPDAKIVAVGSAAGDSLVARLRPGGALDPGFGAAGIVRRSLGPAGPEVLTGVGVAPSGAIVAGGTAGDAIVVAALTGGDSSDPALTMTADGLGDLVTFTVSATNRGADPARDVRIDVSRPTGLAASALTTSGGVCASGSCLLGTLPAGATARVTLLARARRPGAIPAGARASTATFDADAGNNSASVSGTARRNRVVRRDRTKPAVVLRLPARRLARVRRYLRLRVRTSEAVSVRFTARGRRVRPLVRARRVTLARKGAHRVRLRLTAGGRKAVTRTLRGRRRAPRRLAIVVRARATDRAGNAATRTLRKTLRR